MIPFKKFFVLRERKSWGKDVLDAGKIAQFVMKKILNKELSLYPDSNTLKITLPTFDLKIILKAFNNYKDPDYKANAFFLESPEHDSGKIEIFIFEIYRRIRRYRGLSIDKLNTILYNFVKNNYSTELFMALQHELEHAFEYNRGTLSKGKHHPKHQKFDNDIDEYLNRPEEINARIVEHLYPLNAKWSSELKQGIWLDEHNDELEINDWVKVIVKSFDQFPRFTKQNKQKYIKGLFTTLHYMWDFYRKAAQQEQLNRVIKDSDIDGLIKRLT